LKIVIVTDGLYPWMTGGMQIHSYYLVKYLSKNNVLDVYHFHNRTKKNDFVGYFFDDTKKNINFIELPFDDQGWIPGHYIRSNRNYSKLVSDEILKRTKPDLIICKGFTAFDILKCKKQGLISAPVCVNFHGFEMFQRVNGISNKLKSLMFSFYVKNLCENSDYIFSYGGKITKIIGENINVANQKILEFPSGVEGLKNMDSKRVNRNFKRFVFIGRFEDRKGIKELNNALNQIIERKDWTIDFIGPIPLGFQLKDDKVRYHGLVEDKNKIFQILCESDVLVCPSWSEGMPNVILEALSCGVPVIATDVGANSLLINEKTGWLLKEPIPSEIKITLEKVIKLEFEVLDEMRKNCFDHIERYFIWENIAVDMEKSFNKILLENGK
jgi:glycosyltransferase involved in cell wall biosynthesis